MRIETTPRRSPLTPLPALLTFLLATVLLLSAGTAVAAHSVLIGTTPGDGDTLESAPQEVTLTFNEDLVDLGTEVVVTGPEGQDVSTGETDVTGPVASRALPTDLPAGDYEVTWRVTSADGHPISGTFVFSVTGEAAEGPEPTTETTEAPAPMAETPDATSPTAESAEPTAAPQDEASSTIGWLLAGGAVLIVVIVGGVLLLNRRRNGGS